MVQHELKESVEVHFFTDQSECKGRVVAVDRSSMGRSKESMVEIPSRCTNSNGGSHSGVGNTTTSIANSLTLQCEPERVSLETKIAKETTDMHHHHKKQAHHETDSSLPTHDDFQYSCIVEGARDGSASGHSDDVTRGRTNDGGAQEDRMEFDEGGEVDTSY